MSLPEAFGAAGRAVAISRAAPLSARHAMQAAAALDHLADQAWAQRGDLTLPVLANAADILTFRAALAAAEPALAPLMALMSVAANGPCLAVQATPVPPDGFAALPVSDLMVSLYNQGTVPRLMLIAHEGRALPLQDLLTAALAWWSRQAVSSSGVSPLALANNASRSAGCSDA